MPLGKKGYHVLFRSKEEILDESLLLTKKANGLKSLFLCILLHSIIFYLWKEKQKLKNNPKQETEKQQSALLTTWLPEKKASSSPGCYISIQKAKTFSKQRKKIVLKCVSPFVSFFFLSSCYQYTFTRNRIFFRFRHSFSWEFSFFGWCFLRGVCTRVEKNRLERPIAKCLYVSLLAPQSARRICHLVSLFATEKNRILSRQWDFLPRYL